MRALAAAALLALLAGCTAPASVPTGATGDAVPFSAAAGPSCASVGNAVAAPRVVGHFSLGNGNVSTLMAGMPATLVDRAADGRPGAQRAAGSLDAAGCVAFPLPAAGDYYLLVRSEDAQRRGCWWSSQVPFTHAGEATQDVAGKVYYACV